MLAFHSRSNRELPDIRSGLPCSGARVKTSSTTTPGTPSEPPPSRDSRSICDGWRPKPRHDRRPRVPAHRLRVRTSPPNRSNCPRWRASEHCSEQAAHAHSQAGARVPAQLSRRPDMRESVCDARRAAPCLRAGLGRDMRYVVVGAAVLPRAPAMWDDGVDGGPGLRREMRRLLESRVFMRIGQSACGSVGPWDLVGTSEDESEMREQRPRRVHAARPGHGSRLCGSPIATPTETPSGAQRY